MATLRNLATRPHPTLPQCRHLHRLNHQIPVTTTQTSHQTTHPTNHLNQLCRPPEQLPSSGDLDPYPSNDAPTPPMNFNRLQLPHPQTRRAYFAAGMVSILSTNGKKNSLSPRNTTHPNGRWPGPPRWCAPGAVASSRRASTTRTSRVTRLRLTRPSVSWAVSLSSAIGPGGVHGWVGPVQQVYPLCQGRVSGCAPLTGRRTSPTCACATRGPRLDQPTAA